MKNIRVYVEKKQGFRSEAEALLQDFNHNLNLKISNIRLINVYELFNVDENKVESYVNSVLSEVVTDNVFYELDLEDSKYLAVESLPSQFCQRSESAMQCIKLIDTEFDGVVKFAQILIFEGITNKNLVKVENYYINKIESRKKDLSVFKLNTSDTIKEIPIVDGFIKFNYKELEKFLVNMNLAMNIADLVYIQNYFQEKQRDPSETEILLLDTYWSDHCRHTTFETMLDEIVLPDGEIGEILEDIIVKYHDMRAKIYTKKRPVTLMDIATVCAKYLKQTGKLDDLEISDEVNAASIYVDVDVDGKLEKWLMMFKNETHNHPTEIEPYGGASTCVGGAIRDPLSGRSYVYQAMRISGSGNPFEKASDTLKGKLPQRKISEGSALGYSSYGNQIGLTTTYVRELVDYSYVAKHLEVGAVIGATKASNVLREKPVPGDMIILVGGKTGRDGIGGATGSSKVHKDDSLETGSSEVQKGNAIEERKIQRLFRNPSVAKLIKKCNDFGAGGVSVSIGELADGVRVDLDKVPLKNSSLNGTEIALSESQERMSVVVAKEDAENFIEFATLENVEAVVVAEVIEKQCLEMFWQNQKIVNIDRDFIDSAGVRQHASVEVEVDVSDDLFKQNYGETLEDSIPKMLACDTIAAQKGLVEMFDSTIGASTVLMPFGGKNQLTPSQAGVQKFPVVNGNTDTCSILTYGFNTHLAKQNAFYSAMYAVIESISKVVAVGGDYQTIKMSFQEYFEKLGKNKLKWGKPVQALLGAMHIQSEFELAAVGGKDSMSGTFNDINVIPTLISFATTTCKASKVISPEFKQTGNYIYLFKHSKLANHMPNTNQLKAIYNSVHNLIDKEVIISASAIEYGIAESLCKMSFGNDIGVNITTDFDLFEIDYGTIIVESTTKLDDDNAVYLGQTSGEFIINEQVFDLETLKSVWLNKYDSLYKVYNNGSNEVIESEKITKGIVKYPTSIIPTTFIPVFPGTNCEYDIEKAFKTAGANTKMWVFRNASKEQIETSIKEMAVLIDECDIFVISGGFSAADEPDGSGKYIATILNNEIVKTAIQKLLERKGLILGICNGFQALIKCGLLPYGEFGKVTDDSPTIFKNEIGRHISLIANTKVMSVSSPWLTSFNVGDIHNIPISHGEGNFTVNEKLAKELFANGQVAFCYANETGELATDGVFNPNGSDYAIEGIISKCGQILGKMGHSERMGDNLYKNIPSVNNQDIFANAIAYFKGEI